MSRRASMTRHSGGSFGPSSSGSQFSFGGHGRHSSGSFGPSGFGPPMPPSHHHPPHHPPPLGPPHGPHNHFPRPYYQPYYFWPRSAVPYSSVPGDGHQMAPRESVALFDRKALLLSRCKAVYTFLLFALCIVLLWLYTGVYSSSVIQLGVHDSRLLSAKPFFVKTVQVKNRYEIDGPQFYEFDHKPALDQESDWKDVQSDSWKHGYTNFYYWLNKGSTVDVHYTLNRGRSDAPVFLMFLRDNSGDLKDFYDRPSFGPSVQLGEEGLTRYESSEDDDYVFSLVTRSRTNVTVNLDLHFRTREYSTAQAIQHSKLKTSYEMTPSWFGWSYGLLMGPGRVKDEIDTWEIELSYGTRWTAIIFSFGLLTLVYLVTKSSILASIHELDGAPPPEGARPPEYAPVAQSTQDAQPSAPTLPSSIPEEGSEDAKKKDIPEDQACTVCLYAPKDSFFVPCGHRATCFACGNRIAKSNPAKCPICREPIKDVKRIYDV